ncbi:MAG: hypothetical protein GF350_09370 [Chitinivibrionales bacterium]|nr:hypothetical protein [Chitinivibrionales bacterium]
MADERTSLSERERTILKEIDVAIDTAKTAYVKHANIAINKMTKTGEQWNYPLAFALLENMKAQQVAQEPAFIAHARNDDGEFIKPVIEALLNHYAHELDFRQMAEEASDWVGYTGLAIAKCGYYESYNTPTLGMASNDVRGHIFAQSLDPRDFFVDTYCTRTDLSDARYCGNEEILPKADAMADERFDVEKINELKINRVGTRYERDVDNRAGRTTELSAEYGLIQLREIHIRNRETGEIEVGSTSVEPKQFVRELDALPRTFNKFNYVPLVFFPTPGAFYGRSILSKVEDICNQLDNAMLRIKDRWQRVPEKIIYDAQKLTEAGKEAIESNDVFNFVEVMDGDAKNAAHFLHGDVIYSDEMGYMRYLVELFMWISGMTYMQLGSGSARTATESGLVAQASDMRSSRRMSIMERWMSTIGSRIWTIARYARENLPVNEILDPELVEIWDEYERRQSDREKIENDTDITVRMSVPVNSAAITRRDRNLETIRRISDEGVQMALAQQGKMIDMDTVVNDIARDSGFNKPITVDIPQQQAQAQADAQQQEKGGQ